MNVNVNVGDTLINVYFEEGYNADLTDIIVTQIENYIIWGVDHSMITYKNVNNFPTGSWLEGVGGTQGLLLESGEILDACIWLSCMSVSDTIIWPGAGLGNCNLELDIKAFSGFTFNIYPNPGMEKFTISTPSQTNQLKVAIYSLSGVLVYSSMLENVDGKFILEPQLSEGMYFIKIFEEENVDCSVLRFIVE